MAGDGFGFHENCAVMARRPADAPMLLEIAAGHARRAEVGGFIAERYREAYNAQVTEFMPTLFAMVSPLGDVISAAGLRRGGEGPLFVEHYLDAPAEVVLEQYFGPPVRRDRIAEIGHLSGLGHGTGRRLFPLDARWVLNLLENNLCLRHFLGSITIRKQGSAHCASSRFFRKRKVVTN